LRKIEGGKTLKPFRTLRTREKRAVRSLIRENCTNYDHFNRVCTLADSQCYMHTKQYTNGAVCKCFCDAVMPLNLKIERLFDGSDNGTDEFPLRPWGNFKPCALCGTPFPAQGRRAYCSDGCAEDDRRKHLVLSVTSYRKRHEK